MDKAHIQHPVSLVQNHGAHAVYPHGTAFHMVAEPSRGGDYDLRPLLEGLNLPSDWLPAVQTDGAHAGPVCGDHPQLVSYLDGQFSGRGQNDRLHTVLLGVDMFDDWNAVSEGFPGAGRGFGDHILPVHHRGDAASLDGGGHFQIPFLDGPHDFRRQAKTVKPDALSEFHNVILFPSDSAVCYNESRGGRKTCRPP